MEFEKRYKKLNTSQKMAVDSIDGPVMVIAGPGTGKTELLSVRVANILKKTDTLPENILCLTFTDSGAVAMRERLIGIIGRDAYKVAIHTFHSFGSEVINQNGQYFYQGAHFRPADELSSYEIIRSIFDELPHNNALSGKLNNEYTYLKDSLWAMSEIKKSGLTSDELLIILDENNFVIEKAEQLLAPVFNDKVSKNTLDKVSKIIEPIKKISNKTLQSTIAPLSVVMADSLENAVQIANDTNSTKPITAWKSQWMKKNEKGEFILKSRERQIKLQALCFIYEQYLARMHAAELYDFDDMILRVVHAMEIFSNLRLNLQEKYQYILVDEFQDTNMAQMRMLHSLTNNEVNNGKPNIMVVGDDDQAIYSFQGADVSNIINFRSNYPKSKIVTLNENYRSVSSILEGSRDIIMQGKDRLENYINDISKQLIAINGKGEDVVIHESDTVSAEQYWLTQDIKTIISSGVRPGDIAVLTRRHKEINHLLPYFSHAQIPISYERQDDVLQLAPIILIVKLARLLVNLSIGRHDDVNVVLPEILAHPAWGFDPIEICKLSSTAYDNRKRWLDLIGDNEQFKVFHDWIINTSTAADSTPLEQILDIIVGNQNSEYTIDSKPEYVSPIYEYFFSQKKLDSNPNEYLIYLEALRTIRTKLREYRPDQIPSLKTFIEFIELNHKIGNTISAIRQTPKSDDAVNIMTVHKSKGMEFDVVYVIDVVDNIWGEKSKSRGRIISYPENLPLAAAGETDDERLRLFYVAITRAKKQLHICYSRQNENGKDTLPASFLANSKWPITKTPQNKTLGQIVKLAEIAWYQPITGLATKNLKKLLASNLENYKLSVTHLNYFLDVSHGGPATFMLHNLLHFPTAKSPSAAFGTAIHDTLKIAHSTLSKTGDKQPVEDIVANFEKKLIKQNLSKTDFENYLQKGSDHLQKFLSEKYDQFLPNQLSEIDFVYQNSIIGDAILTGKLDVMEIDKESKTIRVTDYKTGKPAKDWKGDTDYEKIKLHKYRQQLLFYKLLVENSRDYHNYSVKSGIMQFIEPTSSGDIVTLSLDFDKQELDQFKKLIGVVWKNITNLNLPDVSDYEPNYKGMLAFENDLLEGSI